MNNEYKDHVLPLKLYFGIAAALFVLTGATVGISYIHLGPWNAVAAIGIASVKASLVALFFMHLKYDNKFYMFVFSAAIFFVALFITLTMFDTLRRADIYQLKSGAIKKDAIIYDKQPAEPPAHSGETEAH